VLDKIFLEERQEKKKSVSLEKAMMAIVFVVLAGVFALIILS